MKIVKRFLSGLLALALTIGPVSAAYNPLQSVAQGGTGATTASGAINNLNTGSALQLPRMRAALANVKSGTSNTSSVNFCWVGDSTTEGLGANNPRTINGPVGKITALLNHDGINSDTNGIFGDGNGTKHSSLTNLITLGTDWTPNATDLTAGGEMFEATSGGSNPLIFKTAAPSDTLVIYWAQDSGLGSFSWTLNAGSPTTVATAGASTIGTTTVAMTLGTSNTVSVNWVSGTAKIIGFYAYDSTKSSVHNFNFGWQSSRSTDWVGGTAGWSPVNAIKFYGCPFYLTNLGINDWATGVSPATYLSNMTTILTAENITGDILLVTPAPSATSIATQVNQQAIVTQMYTLASTFSVPIIDEYQRLISYANMVTLNLSNGDNYHPNDAGYGVFADDIDPIIEPGAGFYQYTANNIFNTPYGYNIAGATGLIFPQTDTTIGGSIAIGPNALLEEPLLAPTAFHNTAVGYNTLHSSSMTVAAINNTAIGYQAGFAVTTGNQNVIVGSTSGTAVTTAVGNVLVGYGAGNTITTSGSNTAVGANSCAAETTIGTACTAFGSGSLFSATAAHETAMGAAAAEFVTSGAENTAVGFNALLGITGTKITGADNSCFGSTACKLFQGIAHDNTVVGFNAASLTGFTGASNTILGTAVGSSTLSTGSNNILIGTNNAIDTSAAGTSNTINIGGTGGSWALVTGTGTNTTANTVVHGVWNLPDLASSSAATTGTVCWTTAGGLLTVDTTLSCLASLEELKDIKDGGITGALQIVNKLDPFWYTWKKSTPEYAGDTYEQPGLGAHHTESVDKRLVGYDANGNVKGVRYQQIVAVLVAAVKEQQIEIDDLKKQVSKNK